MEQEQEAYPKALRLCNEEWRWLVITAGLVVALSLVPYAIGWLRSSDATHFTGIIVNVPDNHSYIAKMRQEYEGNWLFRLPFTPEDQPGVLLFLHYIVLGHVARITGLPIIVVFHIARGISVVLLVICTYLLAARLSTNVAIRRLATFFALFGSGFGWFLIVLDVYAPDLWLPEAFPFQAMVLNVHFPLALALMSIILNLLGLSQRRLPPYQGILATGSTAALAALRPGLTTLVLAVTATTVALRAWRRDRSIPWHRLRWIAAASAVSVPYLLYVLYTFATIPSIGSWQAQNVLLSPSPLFLFLGFGLIAILATIGLIVATRARRDGDLLLLVWFGVLVVAIYLPSKSQRRFTMGMGLVLGLLAARAWEVISRPQPRHRANIAGWSIAAIAALTTLVLLGSWCQRVLNQDPHYFLTGGEWAAMEWMRDSLPKDAVVLASTESGIFIPAWAGQRVVYGHPCETIRADDRREQVTAFWAGETEQDEAGQFLAENDVSYAFVGPREEALGNLLPADWIELIFKSDDTKVYALDQARLASQRRQR